MTDDINGNGILTPDLLAAVDDPDPGSFPAPATATAPPPAPNGTAAPKAAKVKVMKATGGAGADLIDRAVAYMLQNTPAVQGDNGSKRTMWAARCVVYGFDLGPEVGFRLLRDHHNPTCQPPWSDKELWHKVQDADAKPFGKPRGWLRDARPPGGQPANGQAPPRIKVAPKIWVLPDLLDQEFPPPKWAVPGLLSEGLTVLAGKPKLGKSWLALNLALTLSAGGMALGNVRVQPGEVLYLSLEDRLRRIQDRARRVMHGLRVEASRRLHVAVECPRQDNGGLAVIDEWMASVPNPVLVIIDVWTKFRPASKAGKNAYTEDYEHLAGLKDIFDARNVSALLIHHCKKGRAEDAMEEVSGTLGIGGATDGTMVLTRARSENEAELFITGRDVEERVLALEFDPQTFAWTSHGDAGERTESKLKEAVIRFLKANAGAAYSTAEIGDRCNVGDEKRPTLRKLLQRLTDAGQIGRVRNGVFRWPCLDGDEAPM